MFWTKLKDNFTKHKLISYVTRRINQRSFWVGVGLAVSAAAILPSPWNFISFGAGVIGSLVPESKDKDNAINIE